MRLFKRPDSPCWYVEIRRGKSYSLRTDDESEAKLIFIEIQKEHLREQIRILEEQKSLSIEKWKERYLKGRSDKSENTTRADELALRSLGDVIGKNFPIKHITTNHIEQFISVCATRGVKPRAINAYLRHIKAALNEAKRQDHIEAVPRIRMLREPKRLPAVFTKEETDKILSYLEGADPLLYRIVKFALWTGARREEISRLKWTQVSSEWCHIIGKGDKERKVYLLEGAIQAMGENNGGGKIFGGIHKDTISHRFKAALNKLGIEGNFHKLRHTSATYMLESGIPMRVIQSVLGHESMSTTELYAEVQGEMIQREMKKFKI
ncbi:MAG: tyrosine-type recombinase/integrase [Proteiniphilum sp.]